jgi:predicted DNA binding CopG/RHH family protein
MSEIAEIIDSLESKIAKLVNKVKNLEERNQLLEQNIKNTAQISDSQIEALNKLKTDYDSLKITNSLLGSDDYKRDTKLKINSLIREIDYCIAQLSD